VPPSRGNHYPSTYAHSGIFSSFLTSPVQSSTRFTVNTKPRGRADMIKIAAEPIPVNWVRSAVTERKTRTALSIISSTFRSCCNGSGERYEAMSS
jgi:hypothetical protein